MGVCIQGDLHPEGVCIPGGVGQTSPCEQTDRGNNITLPQTLFAGSNYIDGISVIISG